MLTNMFTVGGVWCISQGVWDFLSDFVGAPTLASAAMALDCRKLSSSRAAWHVCAGHLRAGHLA